MKRKSVAANHPICAKFSRFSGIQIANSNDYVPCSFPDYEGLRKSLRHKDSCQRLFKTVGKLPASVTGAVNKVELVLVMHIGVKQRAGMPVLWSKLGERRAPGKGIKSKLLVRY